MSSLFNRLLGYKHYDVIVSQDVPSRKGFCVSAEYKYASKKDNGILFSRTRTPNISIVSSNDWTFVPLREDSCITSSQTNSEIVFCIKGKENTIRIRGTNKIPKYT